MDFFDFLQNRLLEEIPEVDDDSDDSTDSNSSQNLFDVPHPDTKILEKFRLSIIEKTGPVRCFKAMTGRQASYLAAGKAKSVS